MDTSWLVALVLGLAYAATPGVVNTECVRRGLAGGFRPTFQVQLGALFGDAEWAALALAGVAALARDGAIRIALGAIGGLFLCRLAFTALRDAWAGPRASARGHAGGHLGTGLLFGLANPAGLAFWAGIGGSLAAISGVGSTAFAPFLLLFLAGALGWSVAISSLVGWGRRFARPALFRAFDALSGVVLGWFGGRLLWTSVRQAAALRS